MRFPLALWVVSYHLSGKGRLWAQLTTYPPVATVLEHAYASLGIFFALSGFLLTIGYSQRGWSRPDTLRYFAARLARIYPLYLLSLAIIAPIAAEQWTSPRLQGNQWQAVLNYVFLLQGWARPPVDWNTPAWSLSCEMLFYFCLPVLLVAIRARPLVGTWGMSALAFAVPVAVHAARFPDSWKPFIYAGDFLAGMAAAGIYREIVNRRLRLLGHGWVLYGPAITAIVALVLLGERMPWLVFDAAMRLASFALVLGLALGGGIGDRLLSSRLFVAGGTAAFAIYILHVPILWWFGRSPLGISLPPIPAGFAYVAVVLLIAVCASRWVEFPADEALRRRSAKAISQLFRPSRPADSEWVREAA